MQNQVMLDRAKMAHYIDQTMNSQKTTQIY